MMVSLKSNYQSYDNNQFIHQYPTRFKNNLKYPRHRLCLYERSPFYMSLRLYNSLPTKFRQITSISKFKSEFRMYLLQKQFESVSEYLNNS